MKYNYKSSLLMGCLMSATMSLMANPAERSAVIEDPAWVLHLDVDALRKSVVGAHILSELHKPEKELQFFVLKAALGSDLRTALHGITVYGASPSPDEGVALVYADLNSERLIGLVKQAEDYRATAHGTHQVYSWIDAKRREKEGGQPRTYSAIYKDQMVIFAQREERLIRALDVLDGTTASLAKVNTFPKFGVGEQGIVHAAARQIDVPADNPTAAVFKQAKLIGLEVRESGQNLLANLSLETKSPEAAPLIADVARGIIAIIALQPDNPNAIKLAQSLSVQQTGTITEVKLKIPADDVVAALKADAAKKAAKEKEKASQ